MASNIADPEQGLKLAGRVRTAIDSEKFFVDALALQVTISIGIAIRKPEDTIESVLKRADANLYKAKNSGRNRVVYG